MLYSAYMTKKLKFKNLAVYICLLAVFAGSYMIRFTTIPFLSVHITNFSITGSILALTLYSDLRKGMVYKSFFGALLFWIVINVAMELFVQLGDLQLPGLTIENFNTPDHIDALSGCIAVLVFWLVVKRYCVIEV